MIDLNSSTATNIRGREKGGGEEEAKFAAPQYLRTARHFITADCVNNMHNNSIETEQMQIQDSNACSTQPLINTNGQDVTDINKDTEKDNWSAVVSRKRQLNTPLNMGNATKRASRDPRGPRYMQLPGSPLETSNRFNRLPIDVPLSNNNTPISESLEAKKTRPPPIHLSVDVNYMELQRFLTTLVGAKGFSCASTRQGVTIYPTAPENYRAIVKAFRDKQAAFHTYQLPEDKAYRAVIRGLHSSIATDDIKQELQERGFTVRSVTNVISRDKINLPLFFVDLEPDKMNSTIFDLTTMLHSRITVEEPRQSRQLVQCKNCQRYGHSKNYCGLSPRCVRCGGPHESASCTKSRDAPATCALCGGMHPGNYRGCTIHRELQNRRAPTRTEPTPHQTVKNIPNTSSGQVFPSLPPRTYNNQQNSTPNASNTVHGKTYADALGNPTCSYPNTNSDISNQLALFLNEMKSLLSPMINLMSQLMQLLSTRHGK
jgi:hypothetical protein